MERLFSGYLIESASLNNISHNVLAFDDQIHPLLIQTLKWHVERVQWLHRWYGLTIPKPLRGLQRHNAYRIARLTGAEAMLFWNTLGTRRSRSLSRRIPLIYYDHCLSWYSPRQRQDIIPQFRGAIACSHASARMLALHWEFPNPISICQNTLLEPPAQQTPKELRSNRSFRIGMAGRLVMAKGINLALYALESLRRQRYDCELHIAGSGPDRKQLQSLSEYLGISRHVHFHGLLSDMHGFYEYIDCFCNPSLLEAFGLACLEAGSHGCPVIASRIDGLPEVVDDGITGYLIEPTVPLSTFVRELDGSADSVPPVSYDPDRDRLRDPMAIEPPVLAEKITLLIDNPGKYARMSHAAITAASSKPPFSNYCHQLNEMLEAELNRV